jgi:hypothetical protein
MREGEEKIDFVKNATTKNKTAQTKDPVRRKINKTVEKK